MKKIQFEVVNYLNSKREKILKKVEKEYECKIFGYIMERNAMIEYGDAEEFLDLIMESKNKTKKKILLILSTTGGNIEPVLKIINTLNYYSNDDFEIFIPNIAKSAGTVLCLGASRILMGLSSEIGPVDTQMRFENGNSFSAKDYCNAYKETLEKIEKLKTSRSNMNVLTALLNQFDKFDNITLEMCEKANQRVKLITEEILKENVNYMSGNVDDAKSKIESICEDLTFGYIDHSDVIDWKKAKKIGLKVLFLTPDSDIWKNLMEIYERFSLFMREREYVKIFFDSENILMVNKEEKEEEEEIEEKD